MGRPLLSTLVAPAAPVVRVAEPEEDSKLPTFERWSYLNAFDPDSDDFFDGDNVVYEAFIPADGIAEQEREQRREGEGQVENDPSVGAVRVPVSSQATVRRRMVERLINMEVPAEDERPELVSPTVDGSSSSGSDTASSGRASPAETDELLDASRAGRRGGMTYPWHPSDLDDITTDFVPAASLSRSLPTTPTRASWLAESPVVFAPPEELALSMPIPPQASSESVDIPTPASPMPQPAQAILPSPMTPPGSVTPRFLTWGTARGTRPRAIDMSPSPTPAGPFGSARASRMSLNYIAPPALRVQQ